MRFFKIFFVCCLIMQFCFSQSSTYILKDTTDSNSIVRKVHRMNELDVRTNRSVANIKAGSTGINIDLSELKKLPNIIGDADPFKSLQYMGGISQAGDASANMNVRGGNNDQNLILLNGCLIQNPTHVLGLFSVFNPDLIDQMKYVKSGIPSEYGGRLSSVVDIKNFSSIPPKTSVDGSVGFISSRLSLKLPLSNKFALYASQRASYIGAFVVPMLVKAGINEKLAQNNFEYSDTNVGFNYSVSKATKLAGHFYTGSDRISITENLKYAIDDNKVKWGNRVVGLQLNHLFSDKFSMAHYINSTEFYLQSDVNWLTNLYSLKSNNSVLSYKTDFIYQLNKHVFKTGLSGSFNKTLPAVIQSSTSQQSAISTDLYSKNLELAWYARDEWEHRNLLLNIGMRVGMYYSGLNLFQPTTNRNQSYKAYPGIEPRLFGRWLMSDKSALKVSASRHYQYFSRVPVINFGVPLEIFVPATATIKPSSVWHFSGGYFRNSTQNNYELSAEIYYKSFANLLEFGGNLNDLFSMNEMLSKIYQGSGTAYGAEFMLKKNTGKFTGWLNYTLGWNYRKFDQINDGHPFLATADRRHDLSAIAMYQLSKNWSLSATFVYATGSRLNLPRSWYIIDEKVILEYSKYNAFKMPDYHRLDISANYKLRPMGKLKSELNFAIYNIYNRANPFQLYYSASNENKNYNYKIKMSYLIPILPTVSWTFHI